MFRSTTLLAGLVVAALLAIPTHSFAKVEHIRLQEPCNGKAGRAVVSYSWVEGDRIDAEHVFSDVCVDLDAMRVISVETSEELIPWYITPMRNTYRLHMPDVDQVVEEVVALSPYHAFLGGHPEETASEAPEVLTLISWGKSGNKRPLDGFDRGSAMMHGFVGGEPFNGSPRLGMYEGMKVGGWVYRREMKDTGLGIDIIDLEIELTEIADGAAAQIMGHSQIVGEPMVQGVDSGNGELILHFDGDEISGSGSYQVEHSILSPIDDRVWKRMEVETVEVNGKLMGEEGEYMYLLTVWEGRYTDFAGNSYPTDAAMTFVARRKE